MVGDYIIMEVTAKNGHFHSIHRDVLGAECFILDLEKGYRSLLRCKSSSDDDYHRLHTSPVLDIKVAGNESDVIIETLNTTYHLARNNFDDCTFTGIVSYTYDVAKKAVIDYFSEMDEQYFRKHNTTKKEVLEDDDVIYRCAALHHILVKEAGIDYAWACDFACSHGLSETTSFAEEY